MKKDPEDIIEFIGTIIFACSFIAFWIYALNGFRW